MAKAKRKRIGQVTFRYFTNLDDGSIILVPVVGKNDIVDPKDNPSGFAKMKTIVAQVVTYAQQQVTALNTMVSANQEMKIIKAEITRRAVVPDIEKLQKPLPFKEKK